MTAVIVASFLSRNSTVAFESLGVASSSPSVWALATVAVYEVVAEAKAGLRATELPLASVSARALRVASEDAVARAIAS